MKRCVSVSSQKHGEWLADLQISRKRIINDINIVKKWNWETLGKLTFALNCVKCCYFLQKFTQWKHFTLPCVPKKLRKCFANENPYLQPLNSFFNRLLNQFYSSLYKPIAISGYFLK